MSCGVEKVGVEVGKTNKEGCVRTKTREGTLTTLKREGNRVTPLVKTLGSVGPSRPLGLESYGGSGWEV